ncbi:MAG: hypothetical protein K0Q70_2495, partial [Rhodospirillales bacterium]|nr:hypothetical protein [Rhodospirillales bacterium]
QSDLASRTKFLSCADDRARNHYVIGFDLTGTSLFKIKLPARGHGYAQHPARAETIVFGRRPGSFAALVDAHAGTLVGMIEPPKGRCFYGHGTFSADGACLYVCEHDDASGSGFIGIYDATRGLRRVDDFAAGGIGPHEVRLMPDGTTLVVAVGGILTDGNRDKLNIASMDTSLAYIDAASGRVVEQVRPPADRHQLSMRHIDIDAQGRVAIAMQYEGDAGDAVPLAALHARGDAQFTYLRAPEDDEMRLKHYLGDIAFSVDSATIAATSPVGSAVALWDARSGDYIEITDAADSCGIAALGDGFLVSGGDGRLRRLSADENEPVAATTWMWDNHFVAVG